MPATAPVLLKNELEFVELPLRDFPVEAASPGTTAVMIDVTTTIFPEDVNVYSDVLVSVTSGMITADVEVETAVPSESG